MVTMFITEDQYDISEQKRRAKRLLYWSNVVIYSLLAFYLILSIIINTYVFRMSINVLFLIVALIFMTSLTKIKRFIIQIDPKGEHMPNYRLMNVILVAYFITFVLYLTNSIMPVFINIDTSPQHYIDQEECQMYITFDTVYFMVWLPDTIRTCISCYMNVKFSRDLDKTNR